MTEGEEAAEAMADDYQLETADKACEYDSTAAVLESAGSQITGIAG